MASTYTSANGIELIATGEQSGAWGDTTNVNLQIIDQDPYWGWNDYFVWYDAHPNNYRRYIIGWYVQSLGIRRFTFGYEHYNDCT